MDVRAVLKRTIHAGNQGELILHSGQRLESGGELEILQTRLNFRDKQGSHLIALIPFRDLCFRFPGEKGSPNDSDGHVKIGQSSFRQFRWSEFRQAFEPG